MGFNSGFKGLKHRKPLLLIIIQKRTVSVINMFVPRKARPASCDVNRLYHTVYKLIFHTHED